jgi:hypothetical protein
MITGLTQIFIWILFILVVGEYTWKGYVKYKDPKPQQEDDIEPRYQLRSKNLEENK